MISEIELEKLTLTCFQDVGWDFLHGPDISPDGDTPERTDYRQVMLPSRVLDALQRLNPQVPEAMLDEVLQSLAKPDQLSLIQNNRAFHEALLGGVPKVVRGFFAPELLLDYLQYFILFETSGDTLIKKIAGYHQFHAVREAVRATVIAASLQPTDQVRARV